MQTLRIESCSCNDEYCRKVYIVNDLGAALVLCDIEFAPIICKSLATTHSNQFAFKLN